MKQIGYTSQGEIIVTCTEEEIRAFHLLNDVASGNSLPRFLPNGPAILPDFNYEPLLNSIASWMQVKSRANELRSLADQIDQEIKAATE